MKELIAAVAIALMLSIAGCGVSQYTARTTASYESPTGTKVFYDSNKNQENFKAFLELNPDGTVKGVHVETTASTPDAAIAAALQGNAAAFQAIAKWAEILAPLIAKGAAIGATGGAAAVPLIGPK